MTITLFLFSELTPINLLCSTEDEYYSASARMNCNCHRYVVLPENSSIRFERSKGKNLGYPQLCTHSLQNNSYHSNKYST